VSLLVDAVVPAAPKDYSKIPYVVRGILDNVDVERAYVVSPTEIDFSHPRVECCLDADVLPYDRKELQYRPNWLYQQLIKLFQDVTANDWYIVIDADIIVNKPLPLWTDEGKPILYLANDQFHGAYFEFNKQVFGFGKVHEHSFLSECTLYNKGLVRGMLRYAGLTLDGFWELMRVANHGCKPAESELYGSFVVREYPNIYEIRHIISWLGGKYQAQTWTADEIEDRIHAAPDNAHLVSMHSWES